jgi:hypothetical protein
VSEARWAWSSQYNGEETRAGVMVGAIRRSRNFALFVRQKSGSVSVTAMFGQPAREPSYVTRMWAGLSARV